MRLVPCLQAEARERQLGRSLSHTRVWKICLASRRAHRYDCRSSGGNEVASMIVCALLGATLVWTLAEEPLLWKSGMP